MRTYRKTKKLYYAKLQAKRVGQPRKKTKITKIVNLLKFELEENYSSLTFYDVTSIHNHSRLSPEEFDKAAHNAMLEMLSITPSYFYQFSISNELV